MAKSRGYIGYGVYLDETELKHIAEVLSSEDMDFRHKVYSFGNKWPLITYITVNYQGLDSVIIDEECHQLQDVSAKFAVYFSHRMNFVGDEDIDLSPPITLHQNEMGKFLKKFAINKRPKLIHWLDRDSF